ncbi:MAG: PilZ domain-containing protein [Candidatus Zapsychrus exili]|nr:PilZ domain-containing protein [Candidatus Zapsychrus exili]
MFSNKQEKENANERQYIRLKSVFPVEFTVVRLPDNLFGINWLQGYTSNVSKGGICLETSYLDERIFSYLEKEDTYLETRIHIPLFLPPIKAITEVAWIKKESGENSLKYRIGLKFKSINPADLRRMLRQARWIRFSFKAVVVLAISFLVAFSVASFRNYTLRATNRKLINKFVTVQQQHIQEKEELNRVSDEKRVILRQIEGQADTVTTRKELQLEYEVLARQEKQISDRFNMLEGKREGLEKQVLEKMYLWLKNHQSPSTGLVLSFEGSVGIINHWSFTYDQALAVNVFMLFEDYQAAKKILDFFNKEAKNKFGGFANAYYFDSGDVTEFVVHCGPNIWLGIAIMQYTKNTGDYSYMPLAQKIADWTIHIQDEDPVGGIKGGPESSWFATEHNLDAYAFFEMIYSMTKDTKYELAKQKSLFWLKTYAMIPHSKDYKSPPIKRGKGDATIATDTFAWSLATLGPEKLIKIGMDPEQIMNFAEKHCKVNIKFKRPSDVVVDVEGFDFSKETHMPRGGLVSPEWTSQMIISFQILSEYFEGQGNSIKAGYYIEKSEKYLNELKKLIISSPSARGQGEGCLPYATLANADTGHGWNTPFGIDTCSVAGTAYMIMALKDFNPLMFDLPR